MTTRTEQHFTASDSVRDMVSSMSDHWERLIEMQEMQMELVNEVRQRK